MRWWWSGSILRAGLVVLALAVPARAQETPDFPGAVTEFVETPAGQQIRKGQVNGWTGYNKLGAEVEAIQQFLGVNGANVLSPDELDSLAEFVAIIGPGSFTGSGNLCRANQPMLNGPRLDAYVSADALPAPNPSAPGAVRVVLDDPEPGEWTLYRDNGNTHIALRARGAAGAGVVCGDRVLGPDEQCDVVGGTGMQGVCASLADCNEPGEDSDPTNDCRCATPSPCGDGEWNPGTEGCDTSDDTSPCQGSVTVGGITGPRCQQCQCVPTCGDGIIDTGTAGGSATDENCEFPQTGGTDFGTAALWTPNGCSAASNGCALIRDQRGNVTDYDFPGATAMTVMVKVRLLSPSTASQRLVYNGGNNDTTVGWLLEVGTSSRLSGSFSPDATANSNLLTLNGTTTLLPNVLYTAFLRKASNGTGVSLYLSNPTTGIVAQEASGTIAATLGNSSQALILGGTSTSSGPFRGDFMEEVAIWSRELSESEMNARVNAEIVPANETGLVLLLDFDGADSSTQLRDKSTTGAQFTMLQGADGGTVAIAASPWSSGTGGEPTTNCGEACGCTGGQVCNPSSCRCATPSTSTSRTFYVAPTGNDANYPCTTSSAPCRDPNYVLAAARVQPGDRIILRDNTDAQPYPNVRWICGTTGTVGSCDGGGGATSRCGTADAPITLECENEGQCAFISDGSAPAVLVQGCQWFRLRGFGARSTNNPAATGSTNHNVYINWSGGPGIGTFGTAGWVPNWSIERVLGDRNNSCGNNHVFGIENSTDGRLEEVQCLRNSRHCVRRFRTRRIETRRNYFDTHTRAHDCPGQSAPSGGPSQEQLSDYPGNESLDQNNLYTGPNGWGRQMNGQSGLGGIQGTSDIVDIGSIAVGTALCGKHYGRPGDCRGPARNTYRHFLCARPVGLGLRDSITVDALYDRVTIFGAGSTGLLIDDPATGTCSAPSDASQLACGAITAGSVSATIRDSVITGSGGVADVNIVACQGTATRQCTLTNVSAGTWGGLAGSGTTECTAGGGPDDCDCTGNDNAIPADLGDSGLNMCLTTITGTRGARIQCRTENGITGTGAANNLWYETGDTTPGGALIVSDTECAATPPPGPVRGCRGGPNFCMATRAGWNDGTTTGGRHCRAVGLQLNQQPDNGGCNDQAIDCP